MSWFTSLQKQYQQGWKHIIRPPRTPYSQIALGPQSFKVCGVQVQRHDFILTNRKQYDFACSLWLPISSQKINVVVYLHGNTSNRLEGMEYRNRIIGQGLGLCTFDFNGCGNAEGQFISLGFYQKQQVRIVTQYLREQPRIDKIALWGRSMGAVTALLYLPEDNHITSVVLDSPFKSLKGLVQDMAAKTSKVPGFVLSTALKIIERTIKQKADFSISKLNPLKYGAPKIFIPGFFIVGIDDDTIPIQHTGDLFEVFGADDKIIKMVNGGHNDNRPDIVLDSVVQFMKEKFQNEEKIEKSIPQTLDTKSQQKQDFSPLKIQEGIQRVQEEQLKQQKKQSKFSFSKIFSLFSKSPQKKERKQKQIQQKIQEVHKEEQKKQKEHEIKVVQPQKVQQQVKQKKKKSKKSKKKKSSKKQELSVQQEVREYSYCYV